MSANPQTDPRPERVSDMTEPLYFGPGQQLFGWLHRPLAGNIPELGLVICNPFGYESICSHRSVRAFAEAAAISGVPSLRFDYLGSGDSAEIAADLDQIEAWTRDVAAAVSELRTRTGVRRVCLLGLRLGALLAVLAAQRCSDISGLMVIAPIVSGRRYLKELRTTRMAAMLGSKERAISSSAGRVPVAPMSLEVSGFSLSPATLLSLGKVDLCALGQAPASQVFVIDGESLPVAHEWAEALSKVGASVQYHALPGTVEMLMTAPQFAVVPRHMIAAMQDWLLLIASLHSVAGDQMIPGGTLRQNSGKGDVMILPVSGVREPQAVLTEQPARFGPDGALFGIVTQPPPDERRRRGVILLNPGVDHHIGASRLYVSLARQWGARGFVVLRMDLAGIGDSSTRSGSQDDEVFPASAMDDIRSAIDHLERNYDVGEISLAGLCSGAYHALRAAAAGIVVHRIMMINPQNYFWKEGTSLKDLQLAEVVRNPGVYRQQLFSPAAWKRLIGGEVNLYRIGKVYVQRLHLAVMSAVRDFARRVHIRISHDLGRELEEIVARGVAVVFVFARGEPGIDLLKLEAGSSVARLGSRCQVHILDSGDHVFSQHDSRAELEAVLGEALCNKKPHVRLLEAVPARSPSVPR